MNVAPVHSPIGGSIATRVLRCPASVNLVEKVPAHLRKTSFYADRGTALHGAMSLLLDDNAPSLDSLVGKTIDNYTITRDDVENALRPVYAYVDALLAAPGAAFFLEWRVEFPTVAGAYGTLDLLACLRDTIHLIDFKFGALPVLALTPDGDEDVINGQLLFYACAARHSFPKFFAGVTDINLTILQPTSIELGSEMVSSVAVTHNELDTFIAIYRAACAEALTGAPRLERGAHCRFCAARPICPLHTGPLLDLAQFELPAPSDADYLQLLAEGLDLFAAIKDIGKALHDQAKKALHAGGAVLGYTLSAGRAERHWRDDEATTIAALERLGLMHADIIAKTVRSPRQLELRAKARSVKVPTELIDSHRSGVALVRSENARAPVPGRSEIVRSFTGLLEAFQGGRQP